MPYTIDQILLASWIVEINYMFLKILIESKTTFLSCIRAAIVDGEEETTEKD